MTKERVRRKEAGFIGVKLAVDGDMTLYKRLLKEKKDTTMNISLIIRLALQQYFAQKDS